jgi:hypothetical protein
MNDLKLLCRALNKLFWKCPMPEHLRNSSAAAVGTDDWARYWLAELADMPPGEAITSIVWNAQENEFQPAPPP